MGSTLIRWAFCLIKRRPQGIPRSVVNSISATCASSFVRMFVSAVSIILWKSFKAEQQQRNRICNRTWTSSRSTTGPPSLCLGCLAVTLWSGFVQNELNEKCRLFFAFHSSPSFALLDYKGNAAIHPPPPPTQLPLKTLATPFIRPLI